MSTSREAILASLQPVAERLLLLQRKFVFVGGSIAPFYVTDPRISEFRPTKDVDVIVEAITRSRMDQIEEAMRENGFQNVHECIHRFLLGDTLVDVLPVQSGEFVSLNRWYPTSFETAVAIFPTSGLEIFVPTPPCFLATKFEAFSNRGNGDFLGSKDIEDVLTVIGGRKELVGEIRTSSAEVRGFLAVTCGRMMDIPAFRECVEGNVAQADSYEDTVNVLVNRIKEIAQMEN